MDSVSVSSRFSPGAPPAGPRLEASLGVSAAGQRLGAAGGPLAAGGAVSGGRRRGGLPNANANAGAWALGRLGTWAGYPSARLPALFFLGPTCIIFWAQGGKNVKKRLGVIVVGFPFPPAFFMLAVDLEDSGVLVRLQEPWALYCAKSQLGKGPQRAFGSILYPVQFE